jgi:hypothetical protein
MKRDTGGRRIPLSALIEGDFLESKLPVQAFATLTTSRRLARYRLDELFSRWIQGVQAHDGWTIGWIKAEEYAPQRHVHAALIAASPLDCAHAARLWKSIASPRYSRAAKIERYRKGICGLGYVLKTLGDSLEDAQFSPNLPAFAPSLKPVFPANSAQKRQRRRIMQQFQKAAQKPRPLENRVS